MDLHSVRECAVYYSQEGTLDCMNMQRSMRFLIPRQLGVLQFHPDHCYVLDSRSTVVFASSRVLEHSPDVLGQTFHPYLAPGARHTVSRMISEAQDGRVQENLEVELRPPDKAKQILLFSAAPITHVAERSLVLLVGKDVTAARSREAETQVAAIHDVLTGLLNRRYLEQVLTTEESRGRRYARAFALLFIDVDEFKTVNDKYGHKVGDDVLRAVANEIQRSTRDSDVVCRYGGDEFVVLMPETDTDVPLAAERIRSSVEESTCVFSVLGRRIGVSIGFSCWNPKSSMTADDALQEADESMYRDKRRRKFRIPAVQEVQVVLEEISADHERQPSL